MESVSVRVSLIACLLVAAIGRVSMWRSGRIASRSAPPVNRTVGKFFLFTAAKRTYLENMLRQYELVERVLEYDPDADEAMLNRAYVYTVQKHGTQTRASGDPYFSHPVEVAGLMTDLKLDQETIATALLHDTVEDTLATIDDIEAKFGKDVARLVDGVTKLSKIEQMPENERAAEKGNYSVLGQK